MTKNSVIKILRKFKEENQTRYKLLRIGLFGSYARNEAVSESDIDIVVELSHPDMYVMGDIKYDLEKMYNCEIDLIRLREKMNSVLKEKIEKEAVFV